LSDIDCPYCRLQVHPQAVLCPHCRSPLGLVAPLTVKVAELEAEVQRLRARLPVVADESVAAPPPQPSLGNARVWLAIGLAVGANLALHALLLFVYDLPPVVLRMSTLAAPALMACLLYRGHRFGTGGLMGAAALAAVASVLGMLGITAHLDAVPFWPQSPAEWRELLEYTLAIALGYGAGGFTARALDMASRSLKDPSLLVLALKRDEGGHLNVERLAERLSRLVTSVTPVATGALAVYSALRSLVE
jgi:hypothetical protein